ncbi:hypothetical protein B0A80_08630 [Flavobacterium tructae]|uniref:hypothetical protein n=1 Tax=Flavobacterium tructae TaxID=1114873 RepID=UPI000B5BC318|nr:hypothetical protein [Flavobacterium tructae]OXB24020.1 hypothetical protein B0A80_08630 [Flavobacterium tructae]
MKTTKILITAVMILLISIGSMAQNKKKEQAENQLTITGITGQSIKESADVNNVGKLIAAISDQIVKEKLAPANTSSLSYMLNSKEFIINGVKQKPEVQLRYKNKYIGDHTKWNICKNFKTK